MEVLLDKQALAPVYDDLVTTAKAIYQQRKHGNIDCWLNTINQLPELQTDFFIDKNYTVNIGNGSGYTDIDLVSFEKQLLALAPWRKGPFSLFGLHIDSEWQSNFKWRRIAQSPIDFHNKRVLDVGCGNGYYMFQMLNAGAKYVLGIDPSQLFVCQFYLFKKFLQNLQADILPLRCEEFPFSAMQQQQFSFDMVFSMGVLYHRKEPLQHLQELKNMVSKGGEIVIETLVLEGKQKQQLIPQGSYAKMSNVWSVPTESLLRDWLCQAGLKNIEVIDVTRTTVAEQRKTKWITGQSLADFLHPQDVTKTIEGYPSPIRILIHCQT